MSQDDGDAISVQGSVSEQSMAVPYQEAELPVPRRVEPHEVKDQDMVAIATKIIEIEGPIHESEVVTRIRILWNLARAGGRIQAKVKSALVYAVRRSFIIQEEEFYLKSGADIQVRDRSEVSSSSLRKPECLPPHEIKKAILMLIGNNFGASRIQLPAEVARLFGFKATSAQLREVIEPQIEALLKVGEIQETGDHLILRGEAKLA